MSDPSTQMCPAVSCHSPARPFSEQISWPFRRVPSANWVFQGPEATSGQSQSSRGWQRRQWGRQRRGRGRTGAQKRLQQPRPGCQDGGCCPGSQQPPREQRQAAQRRRQHQRCRFQCPSRTERGRHFASGRVLTCLDARCSPASASAAAATAAAAIGDRRRVSAAADKAGGHPCPAGRRAVSEGGHPGWCAPQGRLRTVAAGRIPPQLTQGMAPRSSLATNLVATSWRFRRG